MASSFDKASWKSDEQHLKVRCYSSSKEQRAFWMVMTNKGMWRLEPNNELSGSRKFCAVSLRSPEFCAMWTTYTLFLVLDLLFKSEIKLHACQISLHFIFFSKTKGPANLRLTVSIVFWYRTNSFHHILVWVTEMCNWITSSETVRLLM